MNERRNLHELVTSMRAIGVARSEVDRVDPSRREVGNVRPGLLGLDATGPGVHECLDEVIRDDLSGR